MASEQDLKDIATFALEMIWPEYDKDNNGYLDKSEINALIE